MIRHSAVILSLLMLAGGCAKRTLTVHTEPEGALVWINGMEAGRSPFTVDFSDYGNCDVVVRMDGFETLKTSHKLSTPFVFTPPLDLFAELFGASDHQEWTFKLQPLSTQPIDPTGLIARGVALRKELRSSEYTKPASMPSTRRTTRPSTRGTTRPSTQAATVPTTRSATQPTTQPSTSVVR